MTQNVQHAKKWPIILTVVFIAVGCAAWICQLTMGLLVGSGMSNTFAWGLMIAVFAFLVGFGAGSQFVACYIVLGNRHDLMPYVKTAQVVALAGAIGAGVAILIDLGHPAHIMAMLMGPNPTSPLTWDMIALTVFIVIAIINLIAVARQSKLLKFWMVLGLISAFALQLVEGLLFALMEARIWWHSFIMPIDFIVVAVVCGLAVAVIICALRHDEFKPEALHDLSFLLAVAIIIHLALAVIELLIVCFGGSAADGGALAALGSVWLFYALELGLPLAAVFVLLRGKNDPTKNMLIGGVLVVVGMFFHRLMLLYPAFASPTLYVPLSNEPSPSWPLPASTGLYDHTGNAFEIAQGYIPNFFEWASMLLPLGVALAVFLVGTWFVGRIDKPVSTTSAQTFDASHAVASDEAVVVDEIDDEPIDGGIVDKVAVKEAVATDKKEKSQ